MGQFNETEYREKYSKQLEKSDLIVTADGQAFADTDFGRLFAKNHAKKNKLEIFDLKKTTKSETKSPVSNESKQKTTKK